MQYGEANEAVPDLYKSDEAKPKYYCRIINAIYVTEKWYSVIYINRWYGQNYCYKRVRQFEHCTLRINKETNREIAALISRFRKIRVEKIKFCGMPRF